MPRIKAKKTLEEIETGKINLGDMQCDRLFDVVFLATGSEQLANTYRVAAIKAQTRQPTQ